MLTADFYFWDHHIFTNMVPHKYTYAVSLWFYHLVELQEFNTLKQVIHWKGKKTGKQ